MRSTKGLTILAGLAFAVVSLSACTFGTTPGIAETTPSTGVAASDRDNLSSQGNTAAECETAVGRSDTGPRSHAAGSVTALDSDGLPLVYELATGDTWDGVSTRFCLTANELAETNYATASSPLYADEHLALASEGWESARRASGYLFPACPMNALGHADRASIAWATSDPETDLSTATNIGTPVDTGPAEGAMGAVRTDETGALIDYTVVAGDYWRGLTDRFCMDDYYVASLTGHFGSPVELPLHPGDVLPLQPAHAEIRIAP